MRTLDAVKLTNICETSKFQITVKHCSRQVECKHSRDVCEVPRRPNSVRPGNSVCPRFSAYSETFPSLNTFHGYMLLG